MTKNEEREIASLLMLWRLKKKKRALKQAKEQEQFDDYLRFIGDCFPKSKDEQEKE